MKNLAHRYGDEASGYLRLCYRLCNQISKLAEAAGIKGVSIQNSSEVDEKLWKLLTIMAQ